MLVDEQVAMTVHILAHHQNQRIINANFERSAETISRHFRKVINAIIRIQDELLKKPELVPDNSTDERWKWFKGCLGALDGTHIKVHVPVEDKPKYRTRKNEIATNVLGVCSQEMQFIYVLPGWEGSAADGRVLGDAISSYYLVDVGYTNGEGFLAPFRGQRYHLNDWSEGHQPSTPEEFFNMKHYSARNIIDRMYGDIKMDTLTQDIRGRGKNKRKWKYEEDAKLIEALLDMANLGTYKVENGFKPGYLNYVEEKMQVSLPNSRLKAKPHIESRIKTIKKDFTIVYDMLNSPNTSGFGWDPIKKCITAEKSVWDAYLQSHPSHSSWQNKSFPFFEDLLIIFGKDRATGTNAEGPADMMEEIQREQEHGLEDTDASMQSPRNEGLHNQKKRKRSRSEDNMTVMMDDAASVIGNEIAKAGEVFSKAIGVDAEISEKRQRIDSEIRKIHHITTREIIKAVCHIARDHELTDVFFSMTDKGKEEMVESILRGDI
ncbi:hypothetical protein BUALT_Bualt04G0069300 [Buddleja alternifolia]|uniref:Myb/SANT-like domain-containing protein n=1 Tax=Buddleja alternifolia TaxID=168488 RepID=A0AAV6XTN1_9LAMI|nr:hypothetical protein BUALT_Bualt04G0069300 [Buddleja alternifolia]